MPCVNTGSGVQAWSLLPMNGGTGNKTAPVSSCWGASPKRTTSIAPCSKNLGHASGFTPALLSTFAHFEISAAT